MEIWSPVHFEKKLITGGFDGSFNVENRFHFTNLSQCRFTWQLHRLGERWGASAKGSMPSPNIKPGQKGELKMVLPKDWKQYDVLYITAWGADGKEIFTWSFPLVEPPTVTKKFLQLPSGTTKVTISEKDSVYVVSANNVVVHISKGNGILREVRNSNGIIPFNNGPVLQEAVNNFTALHHRFHDDTLLIFSTFNRKNNYNTVQWSIYPSGLIQLQVRYFPSDYFTWFNGINFSFPETAIKEIEYMGNGPYRVWKNRMKGNSFGVWKKSYNNTETGESWIYPEFKGYYSDLYWCRFITTSQTFSVYTDNEDLFLRLFTPAYKTDQWHNYEPLFPNGDISFMQGIPSIGSKTQRAETTGPMGMKNIFYDYEKDPGRALVTTLYFDFRTHQNSAK